MDDLSHILSIIDLNDKRYSEKFEAMHRAVQLAEQNNEKWRANANEWRATMGDREVKFSTKEETKALQERLTKLELYAADRQGQGSGLSAGWSILVTVVGLALTTITLFGLLR